MDDELISWTSVLPFVFVTHRDFDPVPEHSKRDFLWALRPEAIALEGKRGPRGMILPIAAVSDQGLRQGLLDACDDVSDPNGHPVGERREKFNAALRQATGRVFQIEGLSRMETYVQLRETAGIFPLLEEEFKCLRLKQRNTPDADVRYSPIGDRLDLGTSGQWWHRAGDTLDRSGLRFFLVYRPIPFPEHMTEALMTDFSLVMPTNFDFPPMSEREEGLPEVRVAFEPDRYGWSRLTISLDNGYDRCFPEVSIDLSEVWDPLPSLVEFARRLATGDIPVAIEIDAEGPEYELSVQPLAGSRGARIMVRDRYEPLVHLAGVIDPKQFARELVRAFRDLVNGPEHTAFWKEWAAFGGPDSGPGRQPYLGNDWLMTYGMAGGGDEEE